jgi:hypothetical protein
MSKRGATYYARFMAKGRLVRKRLSRDFEDAKHMLNELRADAYRGEFGLIDNDRSWAEIEREFLRRAKQAVRNPSDYEYDWAHANRFGRAVRGDDLWSSSWIRRCPGSNGTPP